MTRTRTRKGTHTTRTAPRHNTDAWPDGKDGRRAGDMLLSLRVPRTLVERFRRACDKHRTTVSGALRTYMARHS